MYIIQKSCMVKIYITLYNVKIYLSTIIEIHFILIQTDFNNFYK